MQILEIIKRYQQIIVVIFLLIFTYMSKAPYEFKTYQFKTTAPYQFTSPPKQSNGTTPTFGYQMPLRTQPTQEYNQHSSKTRIQTLPDSFPTIQSKEQFSISDMKSRLDMLLKQTDNIENRRGNNFIRNQTQTNFDSNYNNQRKNTLDKPYETTREDKTKNYQKYDYGVDTAKYNRNTYNVSPNPSSSTYQLKATNKPYISEDSYKNSYQKPSPNRDSYSYSNQNFYSSQINKNQVPTKQPQRYSEPIPFNQSRKPQSVFVGKIENPEKLNSYINQTERAEEKSLVVKKPESSTASYAQEKSPVTKNDIYRQREMNGDSPSISYNFSYGSTSDIKNNFGELSPFVASKSQRIDEGVVKNNQRDANLKKQISIYELQAKIKNLQNQNNKLKESVQNMTESKQYYRNQLSNQWKKTKQVTEQFETKISEIIKNHQNTLKEHDVGLQKVKIQYDNKITQLKQGFQKQAAQLQQQIQNKQKKIIQLVKEIGDQSELAQIQLQSHSFSQSKEYQEIAQKLEQKQYEINQLQNQIHARDQNIAMLNQTLMEFKSQIEQLKKFKQQVQSEKYSNFDQILMTQMQTINQLKQKIQDLYEKSNQLRQKIVQSQRKNESLINEAKIAQLKHKSEINNLKMEMSILENNKDNVIGTLNKKMFTLEQKYKSSVNEIKIKDEFFKQHLVGRADTTEQKQYIETVLTKYTQSFSQSKEQQLAAELQKVNKKLELYEKYA